MGGLTGNTKTDIRSWVKNNYERLFTICRNVSKDYYCFDLLQSCVEQLLLNEKIGTIDEEERFFFFTRLVRNNINSKWSVFNRSHRVKFIEFDGENMIEEEYEEGIDLDWVMKKLKRLKNDEWYYARLFELYIEEGCSIKKLSERTTIPMNSVSRDIRKVRDKLIEERLKFLRDGL